MVKKTNLIFGLGFLLACLFASAQGATLIELLQADGYTVMYDFVNRFPDLVNLLANTTDTTVFAPTNQAFNNLPNPPSGPRLEQALYYHLVAGAVPSNALVNGELVPSLLVSPGLNNQTQSLKVAIVNGTEIFINNGQVIQPNLIASNGIIHGIDTVLLPPGSITEIVGETSILSVLNETIRVAGLGAALESPTLTAFAPTDQAFANLALQNPVLLGYLLANDTQAKADLQRVLKYHVVGSVRYAGSFQEGVTQLPTLEGSDLTITNNGGQIKVKNANVIASNVLASNGVAHVIDAVLLPDAFNLNLRQTLLGLGLTTLVAAIEEAGLGDALTQSAANFTIFAPTNAAFARLPKVPTGQALVDVLKYHLTNGQITTTVLSNGLLLPSLLALPTLPNTQQLKVGRIQDLVFINNANVTNANNLATNGIVHVIDRVLIPPPGLFVLANSTATFSTLAAAVKLAGLEGAVETTGNLTLFAPADPAFAALPSPVLSYLLTPTGKTDLTNILLYHVVPNNVVYASEITTTPTVLPTLLNGESVTVVNNGNEVTVNQATVTAANILAANGVAHEINQVLVPATFNFTLDKALLGLGATNLTAAINAAGLGGLLTGTTKYTIFAPTNAALARAGPLPSGQGLVDLLSYHVVAGSVLSSNLTNGELLSSLLSLLSLGNSTQQLKIAIDGNSVLVNGINVTIANTVASNGVIHVIDSVLPLPQNISAVVSSSFATLNAAVKEAGLETALATQPSATLFAPTDAAFSKLSPALLNYLLLPQAKTDLTSVLTYHVLQSNILYAGKIPAGTTTYPTLEGSTVSVDRTGANVVINNVANVVEPNLLAANGVVHGIDSVLIPPGFSFNLRRALVGLNETLLLEAIHLAGFDDLLNGTANYTIFAPTNAALAALGNVTVDTLKEVLSYHVVAGYVASTDLTNGELLKSLLEVPSLQDKNQRLKVTLNNGTVLINNAKVTIANNFASNGVVHVINAVLLPPGDIPTVVTSTPGLSTLAALATGVVPALKSSNLTLFAPTDAAFTKLGQALLTYLQLNTSKNDLDSILAYHVVPNAVLYSTDVPATPTKLPTLNGADVTVESKNGTVTVNGAQVVVPNVLASNGVIHEIDEVLIPPGFSFTLRKALLTLDATILVSLIDKVGLGGVIDGNTSFTIFAPTNASLEKLPSNLTNSEIEEILKYHVVAGTETVASLTNGQLLPSLVDLPTLGGRPQQLKVTLGGKQFLINNANVTSADNLASNGVIHVIDRVLLLPPKIPDVAIATPSLSKLVELVVAAGVIDALNADNLTLFAPTDDAFASVGPAIFNYLLLPAAKEDLVSVLTYHVVPELLYSTSIPKGVTQVKTLNGAEVTVNNNATTGSITVNGAAVVVPNVLAANGVAHAIGGVLIPPDFVFNLKRALIGVNATILEDAIEKAGLGAILNGSNPYTIFAPTNAALATLPANTTVEELAKILSYHVVAGAVKASDLSNGQLLSSLLVLPTLNNRAQKLKVNITGSTVFINDATVTIPNNIATNGVVHVIDRVLQAPLDIGTVAKDTPTLSTLVRLIQIVEYQDKFVTPNITALAPSNQAFNALGAATLGYLLLPQAEDALESVLLYHVIPNNILYTPDLPAGSTKYRAADGLDVTITKTGNKVTVNGVSLTVSNVLASNGVAHVLSAVLIPSTFKFSLFNALEGLGDSLLLDALKRAGLDGILNGTTNYTIFAPANYAFERDLPKGIESISVEALSNLLKTHVVVGRFPLENNMELPTLNNETLVIGNNGTTVSLKGGSVTAHIIGGANPTNNGQVFAIDRVLSPASKGGDGDDDDGLSKTWIIVIVVVCVAAAVAVLGVGGYFGYTYWKKRQSNYVAIGGDFEDS